MPDPPTPNPPAKNRRRLIQMRLWRKSWSLWEEWVVAMAIAELVGIGMIAIARIAIHPVDRVGMIASLHIVGLLQGIVLGLAQWLVLRHYIQHVGKWVLVTAIAALIAWLIGIQAIVIMAFSTSLNIDLTAGMRTTVLLREAFLLGAWVGGVMGFAQWLVLKAHIRRAVLWIMVNALAWALGLSVAFIGARLIQSHPFNLKTALMGAITGLTMGAVVGAITGIALIWLVKLPLSRRN
ncbi:MAG TPA: hypothetical protein V6C57_13950 [Coleofasciculaceae cyanobacterium]